MKCKRILILIITIVISVSDISAQKNKLQQSPIDVKSYLFELTVFESNDSLHGKASISFVVTTETKTVSFDLVSRKGNGKGMKVFSVTERNVARTYSHNNDVIRIDFPESLKRGIEKTVEITYSGIPADGLIISRNKYNNKTFFADNWPNRAHHWLACIDHPSDKASVEFIVRTPTRYQVVANGVMIEHYTLNAGEKITRYRESVPLPMKVAVIGVADFAFQKPGEVEGIPVETWVYREDREKGFYDYAQAIDILPFFIKNIGPYPYKKLANVQSKTIFGGMENAGAIFYFENSVTGKRDMEALIAHEIAHQWFGNMVTETHWPHLWLSEGFATYLTHLYLEKKYGIDSLKKRMDSDRHTILEFGRRKSTPVVDSTVNNYMDLLNVNSYQKGSWVLHMLRSFVGDSSFWKGIQTFYLRFREKNASTDDFRKVMEDVSGHNLRQFFKQWLHTPGNPQLTNSWKYDASLKSLSISIRQQQKNIFQFPITIRVHSKDGVFTKSFFITQKETILAFPSSSNPTQVVIDPDVQLLFEGQIAER